MQSNLGSWLQQLLGGGSELGWDLWGSCCLGGALGVPVCAETEFALLKMELFLVQCTGKSSGAAGWAGPGRTRSWERWSRLGGFGFTGGSLLGSKGKKGEDPRGNGEDPQEMQKILKEIENILEEMERILEEGATAMNNFELIKLIKFYSF